jgi:hypothetical protein
MLLSCTVAQCYDKIINNMCRCIPFVTPSLSLWGICHSATSWGRSVCLRSGVEPQPMQFYQSVCLSIRRMLCTLNAWYNSQYSMLLLNTVFIWIYQTHFQLYRMPTTGCLALKWKELIDAIFHVHFVHQNHRRSDTSKTSVKPCMAYIV